MIQEKLALVVYAWNWETIVKKILIASQDISVATLTFVNSELLLIHVRVSNVILSKDVLMENVLAFVKVFTVQIKPNVDKVSVIPLILSAQVTMIANLDKFVLMQNVESLFMTAAIKFFVHQTKHACLASVYLKLILAPNVLLMKFARITSVSKKIHVPMSNVPSSKNVWMEHVLIYVLELNVKPMKNVTMEYVSYRHALRIAQQTRDVQQINTVINHQFVLEAIVWSTKNVFLISSVMAQNVKTDFARTTVIDEKYPSIIFISFYHSLLSSSSLSSSFFSLCSSFYSFYSFCSTFSYSTKSAASITFYPSVYILSSYFSTY